MTYDYDAIIVGGGLFGQVITKALRETGRNTIIFDANHSERGSHPAACLLKPSWFSALGKEVYEPALELLDKLYGVQDLSFELHPLKVTGKMGSATVHWVPPSEILKGRTTRSYVKGVQPGKVKVGLATYTSPLIIVAAGIWSELLLPQYRQTAQKGVAFLWKDASVPSNVIRPWAPYRQLIRFHRGDGVWAGDGTAIKSTNWTDEREATSRERCTDHVGFPQDTGTALAGLRPYAKGHKPCLLEEVEPGLWVASGGAKNGTLAAGWCAHEIVRRTS